MARFNVKNLSVDIVSASAVKITPNLCLFPTRNCPHFTLDCPRNTLIFCWRHITLDCPVFSIDCILSDGGCGVNYSTCLDSRLFLIDVERLVINPADIKMVQKNVKELMEAVQARAPEIAQDMAPQTKESAAFLEKHLAAALEEVRSIKEKLG
jgi:hypothetical protein